MEQSLDQSLISTINSLREETISSHYQAALQELKDKAKQDPLKTEFVICSNVTMSFEMTEEIVRRLIKDNKCDASINKGFFNFTPSILVKVPLPDTIGKKEEIKVEEVKANDENI